MSVVQRCPNCGTTQATPGECDACHEAQVQFFCTNHEPGVWLTGRTCPQCAARAAPAPRASMRPAPALPPTRVTDPRASGDEPARRRPMDVDAGIDDAIEDAIDLAHASRRPEIVAAEREPTTLGEAGGFLVRLALRLVLLGAVLVVAIAVVIYLVARSM